MDDRIFLDTNILLYAYDLDAGVKRSIASEIVSDGFMKRSLVAISVQVLQEFHVNFLKKGGTPDEVALLLDDFSKWKIVDNSLALYRLGFVLQQRWQLSLWDAMILAAAQVGGASILYSEDFNHGQDYSGVRAINPFITES